MLVLQKIESSGLDGDGTLPGLCLLTLLPYAMYAWYDLIIVGNTCSTASLQSKEQHMIIKLFLLCYILLTVHFSSNKDELQKPYLHCLDAV